jgi:lysozyme family protein
MTPFDRAFDLLIVREGGFVDDPNDAGGATKFGISLRAYPHLGYDGIKNLTREQAKAIYLQDYWQKIRGDLLPKGFALCMFDFAVNSGVYRAIGLLQDVLGVTVDGQLGPQTQAALTRIPERELIEKFSAERILFLTQSSKFNRFGKGWTRRVIGTAMEAVS